MNTDLNAESATIAMQSNPIKAPGRAINMVAAQKTAKEFEGVFISQMVNQMFSGVSTDGYFGGGVGEDTFRSMMVDEYSKQIAAQGGIGLSQSILKEMVSMQERSQ
jgi:peptidoglycan hydrolase FlgJ